MFKTEVANLTGAVATPRIYQANRIMIVGMDCTRLAIKMRLVRKPAREKLVKSQTDCLHKSVSD